MVQRILDQVQRGISIKDSLSRQLTVKRLESSGVWKVNLEKPCKQAMTQSSKQHLARQIADVATSDIGTMDSFTQKVVTRYGYLLGWHLSLHFTKR